MKRNNLTFFATILMYGGVTVIACKGFFPNTPIHLIALYLISGYFLLMYLFGPVVIHQTQWTAMDPAHEPFDPRGPEAPPEVSGYFDDIDGELDRLGFDLERSYRSTKSAKNAVGFGALFANRRTREVAKLVAAIGQANTKLGPVRNANAFLGYTTEFSDGTEVVTYNNDRTPAIFPVRRPPYHAFALPQLRDPARLLAAHRALVARFEPGKTRVDPVGDDPDDYILSRGWHRPQAHHVACGYHYRDEGAGVLRPTWKGAILMTWKLAWPVKPIQMAIRRSRAARLLRELEAEGMAR